MAITLVSNQVVIARNAGALYGVAVGTTDMSSYAALAGTNTDAFLNTVFVNSASGLTSEAVASALVTNLGITGDAAVATATNYIVGQLNSVAVASRGGVVNNILNLFSGMEGDAVFGEFAKAWNIKVANAVAYATVPGNAVTAWANIPSTVNATFALTNGNDVATANIFNADQVYTPGGDDRINSLQDEDKLTGTGTNPTLNATLGNANDNGSTIITPSLTGIETVNVAFTGSGAGAVTSVDLQDATGLKAVNINRISQSSDIARIENVKQVLGTMGIANSNSNDDPAGIAEFSFGTGTLATGDRTEGTLNLDNVQIRRVNIGENIAVVGALASGVQNAGYEKLTINSGTTANAIGILALPMDFATTENGVTITGDKGLTLAYSNTVISAVGSTNVEVNAFDGGITQAQGRLDYIDASALTGPLKLNIGTGFVAGAAGSNLLSTGKSDTSGQTQNVTITGTASDDIFYLNDFVQASDVLKGGNGTDTVVIYSTPVLANGNQGVISSVEKVDVQVNGSVNNTITLDFDKIADATSINVRNITNVIPVGTTQNVSGDNAANQVVNLTNLTAAQAGALSITHSTTGNGAILDTTLAATLKSNTANDTLSLTIAEGVNIDPRFNFTLTAANIENVTIVDADTEANTIALTSPASITGTLTIGTTAGVGAAGTFINFDNAARATSVGAVLPGVATVGQAGAATFDQRGGYRLDVDGQANDFSIANAAGLNGAIAAANVDTVVRDTTGLTANVRYNLLDAGSVVVGAAADTRIIAQVVDASKETSDVIVRLGDITRSNGISSQQVLGGSGNDTFIFDGQGVKNSGYTSGDTVAAGTGLDTLVIDGDTGAVKADGTAGVTGNISVQKSEWDNTTGIDVLRLAGNQGAAATKVGNAAFLANSLTNNGYYIEIDNEFVKQTDAGNNLKIISNDGDLSTNVESDLLLNLRPLSQTSNVTFIGANGLGLAGNASNRLQVEDNSANGANALNGGDTNISQATYSATTTSNVLTTLAGGVATTFGSTLNADLAWQVATGRITPAAAVVAATVVGNAPLTLAQFTALANTDGNNDVLEVFNTADVSINDLAQTKNFARIEGTNDLATAQTLKLVLNDTVFDQLADNSHAATTAQTERLLVVANNNANVAAAVEHLNIDASAVTNKFGLDVLAGRGTVNNIVGTAGADKVVLLGNYTAADQVADGHAAVSLFSGASTLTGAALTTALAANGVAYKGVNGVVGGGDDVLLAYTGIFNLGTGDTIETFGGVDLTGATIAAGTTIVAHSSVRLTEAQLNNLAGITFTGAGAHNLQISDDTTVAGVNANLGKVTVSTGTGTLTVETAPTVTNSGTVVVPAGTAAPVVTTNVTLNTGGTTGGTSGGTSGATAANTLTAGIDNYNATAATVNGILTLTKSLGGVAQTAPTLNEAGSLFTTQANLTATDTLAFGTGTTDTLTFTSAVSALPIGGANTIATSTNVTGLDVIQLSNDINSATVGGDYGKALTVNGGTSQDVITVSAATTGGLTLNLNGGNDALSVTANPTTLSVNAGDGDDSLSFDNAAWATAATVNGGNGTDTAKLAAAQAFTDAVAANWTNIETVQTLGAGANVTLGIAAYGAGIRNVITGTGATTVTSTYGALATVAITDNVADGTALTLATTGANTVTGVVSDIAFTASAGNVTLGLSSAMTTSSGINQANHTGTLTLTGGTAGQQATITGDAASSNSITATSFIGTLSVTYADLTSNAATLVAGTGNVTVAGGAATDTVTVTGLATAGQTFTSTATSIINVTAGAGAQTITVAAAGADTITGGAGDDVIQLTATGAVDHVVFAGGTGTAGTIARVSTLGSDTISNFSGAADKLDFKLADFNVAAGAVDGNQLVVVANTTTAVAVDSTQNIGAGSFSYSAAGFFIVGTNAAAASQDVYFYDGSKTNAAATRTVAELVADGDAVKVATVGLIDAGFAAGDFNWIA